MLLGVNVVRGTRDTIAFDRAAVRALRPPVVRLVLRDPGNARVWAEAAAAARIRVLWCLPVEAIGVGAARLALKTLRTHAASVTEGIEIGEQAYTGADTPSVFFQNALMLALSTEGWPILLGAGVDGSAASRQWLRRLIRQIATMCPSPGVTGLRAISCHVVTLGRSFPRRWYEDISLRVAADTGLRLAFTRVRWQLGRRLTRWALVQEAARALWHGTPLPGRAVRAEMVKRWTVDAYAAAQALEATHFLIDAPVDAGGPIGLTRWAGYDVVSGRADATWRALQLRAAALQVRPGA
jgi:hypothetical protein